MKVIIFNFYQGGFVNMFLSVNDFDSSVFHPLSDISGMKPTVFIDGFGSLFRIVVVPFVFFLERKQLKIH